MIFIVIILLLIIIIYFCYNKKNYIFNLIKSNLIDFDFNNETLNNNENVDDENVEDEKEEDNDESVFIKSNVSINTSEISNLFNSENNNNNTKCYLDISFNNNINRIIIECKNNIVPKTSKNFIELCKNKKYKGCVFHRIVKNFMIQSGDYENNDGTGGKCIYGNKFDDENFDLPNTKGTIAMANSGPNTNSSQFFISVNNNKHLNNKHVVFGNIIRGMDVIDDISKVNTKNNKPITDILIYDCGLIN